MCNERNHIVISGCLDIAIFQMPAILVADYRVCTSAVLAFQLYLCSTYCGLYQWQCCREGRG